MFSVCFVWVGLTTAKCVEPHVGGALVGGLRVPPTTEMLEKCADHLNRVAATERTSIVKSAPAAM